MLLQVPAVPLGDLMKEHVEAMGSQFRYVGTVATDNAFTFDISGCLMVTGHLAVLLLSGLEDCSCDMVIFLPFRNEPYF